MNVHGTNVAIRAMVACWLVVAAASAGGAEPSAPARWSGRKIERILILGNSITLHAPAKKIGWEANWGMAASAQEKDYVHVLVDSIARLSGVRPEMQVANIAEFERRYESYDLATKLKKHVDFKPDVIVVAIGENVPTLATDDAKAKYKESFLKLLTTLKTSGQPTIFVRSCFWANKAKDDIMRTACDTAGGVFVDIGKLGKDTANYARSERSFAHAGVANHPGDRGMKAIADALLAAIAASK